MCEEYSIPFGEFRQYEFLRKYNRIINKFDLGSGTILAT